VGGGATTRVNTDDLDARAKQTTSADGPIGFATMGAGSRRGRVFNPLFKDVRFRRPAAPRGTPNPAQLAGDARPRWRKKKARQGRKNL